MPFSLGFEIAHSVVPSRRFPEHPGFTIPFARLEEVGGVFYPLPFASVVAVSEVPVSRFIEDPLLSVPFVCPEPMLGVSFPFAALRFIIPGSVVVDPNNGNLFDMGCHGRFAHVLLSVRGLSGELCYCAGCGGGGLFSCLCCDYCSLSLWCLSSHL